MTRPLPIFKTGNSMAHKILGGWSLDGVYTYTRGSDFSGPIQYTDQYSQSDPAADVLLGRLLHIVNSPAISSIPSHKFCTRKFSLKLC